PPQRVQHCVQQGFGRRARHERPAPRAFFTASATPFSENQSGRRTTRVGHPTTAPLSGRNRNTVARELQTGLLPVRRRLPPPGQTTQNPSAIADRTRIGPRLGDEPRRRWQHGMSFASINHPILSYSAPARGVAPILGERRPCFGGSTSS